MTSRFAAPARPTLTEIGRTCAVWAVPVRADSESTPSPRYCTLPTHAHSHSHSHSHSRSDPPSLTISQSRAPQLAIGRCTGHWFRPSLTIADFANCANFLGIVAENISVCRCPLKKSMIERTYEGRRRRGSLAASRV